MSDFRLKFAGVQFFGWHGASGGRADILVKGNDEKAFGLLNVKQLPIKEISLEKQKPFIEKAYQMLSLNKELQEISENSKEICKVYSLANFAPLLYFFRLLYFQMYIKFWVKIESIYFLFIIPYYKIVLTKSSFCWFDT